MAVLCVCVRADSASLTQAIALSLPSYPQLNMNPITLLMCKYVNEKMYVPEKKLSFFYPEKK